MRKFLILLLVFEILLMVTACTPPPAGSSPQPVDLIPYATSTKSPRPTPEGLIPLTTPLPSPTPFAYTVQSGDTMSQIAERFNVSLDDLQAANPDVSANAMSVGQVINIPGNPENLAGEATPTPAPITVEQIECYPTVDHGMWCFVLVRNDFPDFIENVSAQVTLVDPNGARVGTQAAFLPLNILSPNTALPLAVFFPPDVPFNAKPQVQVLTAIRLLPDDTRYLPAAINNTLVQVNADGYSADVSGVVQSLSQSSAANQVWVAATAYDDAGRVSGFRKWESNASLPAGGSLPFNFLVSGIGGRIARVEFAVEARP
jgi:LysM repeat protein